jgi:hypothetical protein
MQDRDLSTDTPDEARMGHFRVLLALTVVSTSLQHSRLDASLLG